jgi:hypothetical protein
MGSEVACSKETPPERTAGAPVVRALLEQEQLAAIDSVGAYVQQKLVGSQLRLGQVVGQSQTARG